MFNWINRLAIPLFFIFLSILYFQHNKNIQLTAKLNQLNHALHIADEQLHANQLAQHNAAVLDKKHTEQLVYAQIQINQLRHDVITGHQRLRIKADCLPSDTANSGMGTHSTIELARETGSAVLDIRSAIVSDQAKIAYLQDYINKYFLITIKRK